MLWVAALCALAVFVVGDHAKDDSSTVDEPFHIHAAAETASYGVFATNIEHPPLAKMLAAWSMARADLLPPPITGMAPLRAQMTFLTANKVPYGTILTLARQPFRWLLALLIVVVYLTARASGGIGAAMLASAVIALEPNLLAHAGIVHTDVPATLLMTLTIALTIAAALRDSRALWLSAGLVLGLAIAAKFSALILVPLVLLAPLLTRKVRQLAGALIACLVAAVVVFTIYAVNTRAMHPDDAADTVTMFLQDRQAPPETVERLAGLTRRIPQVGLFLTGVEGVRLVTRNGQSWNYLHGRASKQGFPHYFFVAFLVKSTPVLLLLALAALTTLRTKWGLGLLAPVFLLFLVSIPSALNIGVRHIFPAYPLLAIAGATALARLPRRFFVIAAALLIASAGLSLASIHPYELGYFNAFAGGPERGGEWLSDSNIDWGQDLGRLRRFLFARGWQRDTSVVVFATIHHGAELQGLHGLDPSIPPGRYAVSAHMENVGVPFTRDFEGPEAAAMISRLLQALHTRGKKVARVGASITVWELPPPPRRTE